MAITITLLLLFTSLLLLFTLYWFTPFSDYHSSPANHHQARKDLIEAPAIFNSNRTEPEFPLIANNDTSFDLLNLDDFRNIFCNLEPAWPVIFEKDVVMLSEKNFSGFLAKNRYVTVLFYMFWCPPCRDMAPEYAATAKMLKGQAVLAVVDGFVEIGLVDKYNVKEYPTIQLFVDGGLRLYQFAGARKRDAITTWVRRKMALGIYNITTKDEAIYTLHSKSRLVLGFLDSLEGSESEELAAASKLQRDINFYRTARADLAELFLINPQIKRPALILLDTVSKNVSIFHGEFTRLAIADFVSRVKHPLVITFTEENAELILQNPMKQLWLFSPAYGSEKVISTFKEAAEDFRGKLLFVYMEMNSRGPGRQIFEHEEISASVVGQQISHEFGITGDAPRVIAYRRHDAKKYVLNGELTLSNIKFFGEDFLEDKLSSQSEPNSDSVLKFPSHSHASNQLHFQV